MLMIRKEQMQAFSEYMLRRFENRMVEHLKALPSQESVLTEVGNLGVPLKGTPKNDEVLLRWLQAAVRDARNLGFAYESVDFQSIYAV